MEPLSFPARLLLCDSCIAATESLYPRYQLTISRAAVSDSPLCYLLVFDGDSSSMVRLSENGEQIIGRDQDADIQIKDESISRHHARIVSKNGESWLIDLNSHNGTRLNGELLSTPRALLSGDQLQIGKVTLIYHASSRSKRPEAGLSFSEFSQRCTKELTRALSTQDQIGLVVAYLGAGIERELSEKLLRVLFPAALLCWDSDEQLLFMLPKVEDPALDCKNLLGLLLTLTSKVRLGFSVTPTDGCTLESLLSGARAAALSATPGTSGEASQTFRSLQIGTKKVLIADPVMIRTYDLLERLANTSLPILITGETGVGKELTAQAIHMRSHRRDKQMLELNCAVLQENLLEGELFGYQRGAFTGAANAKQGLLEAASGSTLFLDEIGELSLSVQAKLLRVLETQKLTRLGEVNPRKVDLRLIAATNRDLEAEIKAGRFRQDLFFRLKGALLYLPPLRDRPREIQLLARAFLLEACERQNRTPIELSPRSIRCLAEHSWPGNIRELKYVMGYIAAVVEEKLVEPHHFSSQLHQTLIQMEPELVPVQNTQKEVIQAPPQKAKSLADELREQEKARIAEALHANNHNQTRAAKSIQMPLRTFLNRLKLYGLK
jgi:two-component system response regulator AtoC